MLTNKAGSIPTSVWGHSGWKFLFSIAYVYPEYDPDPETKQNYYVYFTHLRNMLPCAKCRNHYAEYLKNNPIQFYIHNRESLFRWLLGLHNQSNKDTLLRNSQDAIVRYLPALRKNSDGKCHQCTQEEGKVVHLLEEESRRMALL